MQEETDALERNVANGGASVNGGPYQLVPPSEITFNNYIAFLFTAADGNTNPMAGEPAWTRANPGSVSGGSWGRTHVNLATFAGPSDRIQLRWDFGTDGCAGRVGWYVDNVTLFTCTPNIPDVSVGDIQIAGVTPRAARRCSRSRCPSRRSRGSPSAT